MLQGETVSSVSTEALEQVVIYEKHPIELPTGFNSIMEGRGILGIRARDYMQSRGFNLEQLDKRGFGYCNEHDTEFNEDYFGYIIIPFWVRGQLQYFIGRDFLGRGEKWRYKNPAKAKFGVGKADLFYNEDALMVEDRVIMVEGWADAETVGPEGISSQGWSLSQMQRDKMHRANAREFIFLPDYGVNEKGESYYKLACKAAMEFMAHKKCRVVNPEELRQYGKDANEIGYDRVNRAIVRTPLLTDSTAMEIMTDD
jgi:hypothetical protein